jgi:hypothetical protein
VKKGEKMKLVNKIMFFATAFAMLGTSALKADDCCYDYNACCATPCCNTGCGYDQCCNTSNMAPAIALGAIAVVAIVAVCAQGSSHHHHHHAHAH